MSNKKTVLITGANGFIGFNVVEAFVSTGSFDVFALVHKNVSEKLSALENIQIIKSDVTDKEKLDSNLRDRKFDIVVHVAGLASDIGSNKLFKKINFDSVKNISKYATEKFIYVSSTDVYGIKDFNNADETTPFCEFPKNPYPRYKIQSELWIRDNIKNYVIIRPAAVFGENDLTLEKRIVDFLKDSPFIVHFGKHKGKNRWPLADVKNVANTILACAMTDEFNGEAINIIDEKVTSIDEYYREIAKKYFPEKEFKTITLPLLFGKLIGLVSTIVSNILKLKQPLFDPTFYAVHHVSSNLDFSCEKMKRALKITENKQLIRISTLL